MGPKQNKTLLCPLEMKSKLKTITEKHNTPIQDTKQARTNI
jgi:hypothetical protein